MALMGSTESQTVAGGSEKAMLLPCESIAFSM